MSWTGRRRDGASSPPPVKQPSRDDPVIKKALDLLKAGTLPKAA